MIAEYLARRRHGRTFWDAVSLAFYAQHCRGSKPLTVWFRLYGKCRQLDQNRKKFAHKG